MSRHRTLAPGLGLSALAALLLATPAFPQSVATPTTAPTTARNVRPDPASAELLVLQALRSNPVTSPYLISVAVRDGRLILSGVVGTKQIHDLVVRMAIETGYPIRDDLKIDTAAAHRVAATPPTGYGAAGTPSAVMATPSLGASPWGMPYVYPPPLFGRLDDPFFGFEPPLLSYPPWYRAAVLARNPGLLRGGSVAAPVPAPNPNGINPNGINPNGINPNGINPAVGAQSIPVGPAAEDGAIEMTLDARGVAVLRGTVGSLADRVAIGQRIAQLPGIVEVFNLLNIKNGAADGSQPPSPSPNPPPPPQPEAGPAVDANTPLEQPAVAPGAVQPAVATITADSGELSQRILQAIERRPGLAALPIKISASEGIATISGQVPTAYEAMLAFRAVQQTPGVDRVIDRLSFKVPDGEKRNPLLAKGRPEDVEPYLSAQLQRQVGDQAHIDQVRLRGDTLEIRGSLTRNDDRARVEAILRSTPILRGFRLEPAFSAD